MLSPITLLLITAALCVVMLFVLGSLARSGMAGVGAWRAANVLAFVALLLYAGRGVLPGLLTIEGAPALPPSGLAAGAGRGPLQADQ